MTKQPQTDAQKEKVPLFKRWIWWYTAVLLHLAFLIGFFYALARGFE